MTIFKETYSFFSIKNKAFDDKIEISKDEVLLKNRIVKLFLNEELKPPWLKRKYVKIFIPEIYNISSEQGKSLAYFELSDKKIPAVIQVNKKIILGFDPEKTITTLIYEKYFEKKRPLYTYLPFHYHKIPYRIFLNNLHTIIKKRFWKVKFPDWPIESSVEVLRYLNLKLTNSNTKKTFWPKNKKYAITLTHDVDTKEGLKKIPFLSRVEEEYNLTSSWNIVGHYYPLDYELLDMLIKKGHEIGLHGFNHDNKLAFLKKEVIELRFKKCSELLEKYHIKGFRSSSLLRSDDLFEVLPKFFNYDSSIPDTEIYSPSGNYNGCCTVFPFFINKLIELPLTMPQDATLLNLGYHPQQIYSIWLKKLNWIKDVGGLAVINTHPEPHFSGNIKMGEVYKRFIGEIIKDLSAWIAKPCEITDYWVKQQT